jgi:hypothetical protein
MHWNFVAIDGVIKNQWLVNNYPGDHDKVYFWGRDIYEIYSIILP